jgi:hypothetical protein
MQGLKPNANDQQLQTISAVSSSSVAGAGFTYTVKL